MKSCITFAILHKMMDYINRTSKAGFRLSMGKNKTTLELSCNCYLCNSTLINVFNKLHVLQYCFSWAEFRRLLLNKTFSKLMQHVFASISPYFYITASYVSKMSCNSFPSAMKKKVFWLLWLLPPAVSFHPVHSLQLPLLLWGGESHSLTISESRSWLVFAVIQYIEQI